ncbi:MAG: leucine-rich repeat domain-containing protein [Fretibacterium sp.]|nr:leucine-rich repeat domain-containing protein [Fretibacterium sp.]
MNQIIYVSLLALLMCCFLTPVPFAEAYGGACGNGLMWDFTDRPLTISGSGAMKDNESPWSSPNEKIKSIIIGEGVTRIGAKAFYNCRTLTRPIISDTVESIGNAAFYGCWGIPSLTMGSRVKTIGSKDIRVGGIVAMNKGGIVLHCSAVNDQIGTTQKHVGMVVGNNREEIFAAGTVVDCNYSIQDRNKNGNKGLGSYVGGSDTNTKRMT